MADDVVTVVRVCSRLVVLDKFRMIYTVDLQPVDTLTCVSSRLFNALVTTVQLFENVLHTRWYQDLASFEDDTCFHG